MTTDPGREVPLVAGKATYTLYAGNRALRLIERETGRPLIGMLSELAGDDGDINLANIEIGTITVITWALLQRHHPELNVDDVDDIIDDAGGLWEMAGALGDAITKAFPKAGGDDAGESGKVGRGTGKRSSPVASPPG